MRTYCFITFLVLFINCSAQVKKQYLQNEDIKLRIMNEVIAIKEGSQSLNLSVNVGNNSKQNYLLYNFKSIEAGFLDEVDCNDGENFGARMNLIILYQNKKGVPHVVSDTSYGIPFTQDSLRNATLKLNDQWIRNTVSLKSTQSETIDFHVNLKQEGFRLQKGKYYIYIYYRAGNFVKEFLGKEQILKDTKAENANLFLGCLKSNQVTLIIE